LVDLACSQVVALNDEIGQNSDVQNMAENVLGVDGEYVILRLLAEYLL